MPTSQYLLASVALSFLLGASVGLELPAAAALPATVGGVASLGAWRLLRGSSPYLVAGFLGVLVGVAQAGRPAARPKGLDAGALVHATVIGAPTRTGAGVRFDAEVHSVDSKPAHGRVRVFAHAVTPPWPGSEIETWATEIPSEPADFPDVVGGDERDARVGIGARLFAGEPVRTLRRESTVRGWLARRRWDVEERLIATLGPERAAVPLAMLTGSKALVEGPRLDTYANSGTAHLLAISGLHFGILAALLWAIFGLLATTSTRLLRRVGRRRACALFVLGSLGAYLVAIGAPVSAQRAFVMVSALIASVLVARTYTPFAALGAAAIVLVCHDPWLVRGLGFQFSFAAVTAILLVLGRNTEPPAADHRTNALRAALRFVAVSWAASVATWPVAIYHFGFVPVVGLATNLFAIPLVTLFLPLLVLGTLLLGPAPRFGREVLDAGLLLADAMEWALGWCASLPGARWTPGTAPLWWTAVAMFAVAVVLAGGRYRRWAVAVLVVLVLALEAIAWWREPAGLRLHFIPVGQGDSTLAELASGAKVLVDAGGARGRHDPGRSVVVPYLRRLGIGELDVVVVTHSDVDHAGGVPAVVRNLRVAEVVDRPGGRLPPDIQVASVTDSGSDNDRSLVSEVSFADFRALLPGDIERAGESAWAREGGPQTLLKLAHHGSRTSTTAELLAAARPRLAVVSAGRHNRFGHPHPDVLRRAVRAGAAVWSTAGDGVVVVDVEPGGKVVVRSMRRGRWRWW